MLRRVLRTGIAKILGGQQGDETTENHAVIAPESNVSGPSENRLTRLAAEVGRILDLSWGLNVLFAGAGSSHHEPYWSAVEARFFNPIYVDPLPGADDIKPGQVIQCALSNTKGSSELFVCETPDASSLKSQNQDSMRAARFYDDRLLQDRMSPVKKIVVETDTIDRLQSERVLPHLDFIKLNVEGSELDVLRGGANALEQCLGIQTEVSFKSLWDDAPHFSDLDGFIRSRGFEFHQLLAPIHHGKLNRYLKIRQEQDVRLYPYPSQQLFQAHVLYLRPDTFVCSGGKMNRCLEDAVKLISLYEFYGLLEHGFHLAELLVPLVAAEFREELHTAILSSARGYAAKYPIVSVSDNVR
jgi:FkbM family methyltransferase